MFACPKGGIRERRKKWNRRDDRDRLDGMVVQYPLQGRAADSRKMLGQPRLMSRGGLGGECNEVAGRIELARHVLAPAAEADDAGSDLGRHGSGVSYVAYRWSRVLRTGLTSPAGKSAPRRSSYRPSPNRSDA